MPAAFKSSMPVAFNACGVQLPAAFNAARLMLRVQLPSAFKSSMLRVQLPSAFNCLRRSMLRV
jgi:hypothetical protein